MTDSAVAQVADISEAVVLPVETAGRSQALQDPLSVLKVLTVLGLVAVGAAFGGLLWFSHEVFAHPGAWGRAVLFGALDPAALRTMATPLVLTSSVLCLIGITGIHVVRLWRMRVLEAGRRMRTALEERLHELDARHQRAVAATEFWKEQCRKSEEQTHTAEAARQELEGRVGRLADREQRLAKEQEALSSAKDRLEKHVEARTVELHRLQRRYESILNCAGEGICSADLEGRIRFVNPAAAAMMGWSREALLGMKESEIFANHGQPNRSEESGVPSASHPAPVLFQRKDSSRFPVELIRTPVEEGGRQVGSVLVFKDVTERTEADERFAAKVAELARSNAELEQFAFVASHDLQEPLRKIQAFGDRLRSRLEDTLSPEASDYLNRMRNAAARMQGLIDGLLLYSRVITRAQPFASVDLNQVVREVVEDLEVRIEKSSAEVQVETLPSIEADALQMRQLFQNLIGNALKFQAPGNAPRVQVRARRLAPGTALNPAPGHTEMFCKEEFCELRVEDNGIGFDESYMKRLFVVFQRLHSRSDYEGTGIGLAVCRKIANRHGGFITAHSTPGKGSQFIVLLPVRQDGRNGAAP